MTANLLTLNSSKTEFLLIGNNNLPKLIPAHLVGLRLLLTPLALLVLSLMNTLLSLTKYLLSLLSYSWTSLSSSLSWLQNCQYHRHFYRSF